MAFNSYNNPFQTPYGMYRPATAFAPQAGIQTYNPMVSAAGYGNQPAYGLNPNPPSFYSQPQSRPYGYANARAYQQPTLYTRPVPPRIIYMAAPPPEPKKNKSDMKKLLLSIASTTIVMAVSVGLVWKFYWKPATRDAKKGAKEIMDALINDLFGAMNDGTEAKFNELLSTIGKSKPGKMTTQQFKEHFNNHLADHADAESFKTKLNELLDTLAKKTKDQAMSVEEFQTKFKEHIAGQQAELIKTTVKELHKVPQMLKDIGEMITTAKPVVDKGPDIVKQLQSLLDQGKDMMNGAGSSWTGWALGLGKNQTPKPGSLIQTSASIS